MQFDRFDVCSAYYMYAVLYNGSDYANALHVRLASLDYKPSHSEEHLCGLSANARAIFAALVKSRHSSGYVHCACCGADTIGVEGVALCNDCDAADCAPHCDNCPGCRGRTCGVGWVAEDVS
jgi:hypothetical protein